MPEDHTLTTPIEPVGGRGRTESHLFVVVAIVLIAIGLSIAKPWDGGSTSGAGSSGGAPRGSDGGVAPSPRPSLLTPTATPIDPSSAFCLSPSGWRLTSVEHFAGREIRVWQTIDPVAATGPLDPTLPVALVVSTSVTGLGWCAPPSGDERPIGPVTTIVWRVTDDARTVRLAPTERSPSGDLGAEFLPPEAATATDWEPGRYVFDVEGIGYGDSHWFAIDLVRFVPDAVTRSSPPRVVHPVEPTPSTGSRLP
jgi:hypothetical protein